MEKQQQKAVQNSQPCVCVYVCVVASHTAGLKGDYTCVHAPGVQGEVEEPVSFLYVSI